ncbi:MAG: radical SAM protein [Candidatus Omnitrophica bacterium]|nr:radical SAM protein [Candidatus Omnitrophota bacterium]
MRDKHFNICEFYIAITNRCNLQCLMCTTGKGKYGAESELSSQEWIKIIGNLERNCAIQRITFGGGEPLLRDDLGHIMKFTCACDINTVNVISNGTLFDGVFLDQFDEHELKKIGIIFSIDGLQYDHDFIRGGGTFKKTVHNFERVYKEYFLAEKIASLTVSSILMPENFSHFVDFLKEFERFKGVRFDVQPVIPNNELCYVREKFRLTEKEKAKLKEIIDYLVAHEYISTRPAPLIRSYMHYFANVLEKNGRCLTGYESLNITCEGLPYLCGKEVPMPLYAYDFKEIFYSEEYQAELERIKTCKEPCLQGLHINQENYGS